MIAGRGEPLDGRVPLISIPLADSSHPDILKAKRSLDEGTLPDGFETLVAALEGQLVRALASVEVVIAHNVCSLHKNLALTAALHRVCSRPGAPALIAWHHDLAWVVPRYSGELHGGWPWDLLRENWANARIRHVTVSERRQAELAGLFGLDLAEIGVIPSGLDLQRFFKLEAETVKLVGRLRLVEADLLLLLPVRITRRKNIELALKVTAVLRESYPQTALIVTGPPGPHNPKNVLYLEELRALRGELGLDPDPAKSASGVHFLAEIVPHYLSDAVISDFYRLADALIFPSLEEGFGIPMIEAGLSGLPIFASDLPVLRELADEGAYFFAPDGDPATIAKQVADTLGSLPGVSLKAKVRQEYSWEGVFTRKISPLLSGL